MKRFALTLFSLAAAFGVALAADQWVGPHWDVQSPVLIRTQRLGSGIVGQTGADVRGGYIDSAYSTFGATLRTDTTVSINVRGLPAYSDSADFGGAGTLAGLIQLHSSTGTLRIQATTSAALASGESLYVRVDGSNDGKGWVQCAVVTLLSPGGAVSAHSTLFNGTAVSTSAAKAGAFAGFPYIRIVTFNDRSGGFAATAGINVALSASWLSNRNPSNN